MIATVGTFSTLKILQNADSDPLLIQGYSLINLLGAIRYPLAGSPGIANNIVNAGFPETYVFTNVSNDGYGIRFLTTSGNFISVRPLSARRWIIADSLWLPPANNPRTLVREAPYGVRVDSLSVGCTDDNIFGGVAGVMFLPFSPIELLHAPNGGLISNSSRSVFDAKIPRHLLQIGSFYLNGGNVIHSATEIAPSSNSIHPIVALGSYFGVVGNPSFVTVDAMPGLRRIISASCIEFFTVDVSGDQDIFLTNNPVQAYIAVSMPSPLPGDSGLHFKCGFGEYHNCSFHPPANHSTMVVSLVGLSTNPRYVSSSSYINCNFQDNRGQIHNFDARLTIVLFAVQGDLRVNYLPAL
jgi:hypothetical protein